MNNLPQHLDFALLADLVEDRAVPNARTAAMGHLTGCSPCAEKFRKLAEILHLMVTDREDAPRGIAAQAITTFTSWATSPQKSLKRRILAALSFDSSMNQASAFGVRSEQSGSRQLIYSADENDIDIRTTLHGDMWIVSGQVLREDCSGGRVEIKGVNGTATATINELCEFTLPEVPSGDYFLLVHMPDVEVEIPELELSA